MRRAYRRFFPLIDLVPYAGTPYHLEELLHHPNPHFRYVGALSAAQNHDLKSELHSERSSFVRRAIAKIMARDSGLIKEGADRQWLGGLAESVPETAYLVEAISRSDASSLRQPWLPSALYTLTFIAEGGTEHIFQGVLRSHKKGSAVISDLARAYEVGLDRYAPSSLTEITDFHLREVIKELSPFDEGGLGMFDELQSIRLIDQLYLFFRQLQFCIERDLISQPAPPNSPGALSASAQS